VATPAPVVAEPVPNSPVASEVPRLTLKFPDLPSDFKVTVNKRPVNVGLLTSTGIPISPGAYDFEVKSPAGQSWSGKKLNVDQWHNLFDLGSLTTSVPFHQFKDLKDASEWSEIVPIFKASTQLAKAPKGLGIASASLARDKDNLYLKFDLNGKPGLVANTNYEFKYGNEHVLNFGAFSDGNKISTGTWTQKTGIQQSAFDLSQVVVGESLILRVSVNKLRDLAKQASAVLDAPQRYSIDVYNPNLVPNGYVSQSFISSLILDPQ
jgi:hypothetical protein